MFSKQNEIIFDFVGYGTTVKVDMIPENCLYLDVGNNVSKGVVDHHHFAANIGSATSMLYNNPDLVLKTINDAAWKTKPYQIILHENPDFDCVCSAYLACQLLIKGRLPEEAAALSKYADMVDSGNMGVTQENPFSLYIALIILKKTVDEYNWPSREDGWRDYVKRALIVVDYVMNEVYMKSIPIIEVDAFNCPGQFRMNDRKFVSADLERYKIKIRDPYYCAKTFKLKLPSHFGGLKETDTLIVRDVQNPDDPNRCMFFKDWAKTDKTAGLGEGYNALSVFTAETKITNRRCILSVKPNSCINLKGLADLLEREEELARIKLYGFDDRKIDKRTGLILSPRDGYDNSDPWYDGRGHGFTIVDSPRSGTILTADQIENLFIEFGKKTENDAQPMVIPSPLEESHSSDAKNENIRMFSVLAECYCSDSYERKDIFISYSRNHITWVKNNLYTPLVDKFGNDKVFFDMHSISPGISWLSALGNAVKLCRVFIPVYSEDYFRKDFCRWEMELAMQRDPTCSKGLFLPIIIDNVEIPFQFSLINALNALVLGDEFRMKLIDDVLERFNTMGN